MSRTRPRVGEGGIAPETAASRAANGVLSVRVADDFVLDGGRSELAETKDRQSVARIAPPVTPMFQQVVEYLERKPAPQGSNVRRDEESRAAVAVCLRWGSYFAVLADPSLPAAPHRDDDRVSHIADDEMARMNIEISAGVAWWLTLRGSNEPRYWDLVHRAVAFLFTGPQTVRPLEGGEMLLACAAAEMAGEVRRSWSADRLGHALALAESHGIRAIANAITLRAWRNGPVEDVHAGRGEGYHLGTRRILPRAEKAIIRQAQDGMHTGLKAVDMLKYGGAWPPSAVHVLPFLHPLIGPSRWSYTEQSRAVELPLRRGAARWRCGPPSLIGVGRDGRVSSRRISKRGFISQRRRRLRGSVQGTGQAPQPEGRSPGGERTADAMNQNHRTASRRGKAMRPWGRLVSSIENANESPGDP